MKEKATFKHKLLFALYQYRKSMTLSLLFIPIVLFIFELIVYFNNSKVVFFGRLGMTTIIFSLLFFLIFIVSLIPHAFRLKVMFVKDLYVVEGHIYKTHMFNKINTGGNTYRSFGSPMLFAKAMSEKGNITTDWVPYTKRYLKVKDRKVKMFIKDNKGIDFYF